MPAAVGRGRRFVPQPGSTGTTSTFVQPSTVGYLGTTGALTVIDATHAYSGSGGSTSTVDGNRFSQTNLSLDHVWVKGSMYWTGTGTLTITNSIIEGGGGLPYSLWVDSASNVVASDTTFRYSGSFPTNSDSANVAGGARFHQSYTRCEFTGQPHGIELTANNDLIDSCWIHDLTWNATFDPHLDGIFVFGGTGIQIKKTYINVNDANSVHTTAAIFMQNTFGYGISGITVDGCYLNGGAGSLYNEDGASATITNNTIDVGFFTDVNWTAGSPTLWSNNKHTDGTTITSP